MYFIFERGKGGFFQTKNFVVEMYAYCMYFKWLKWNADFKREEEEMQEIPLCIEILGIQENLHRTTTMFWRKFITKNIEEKNDSYVVRFWLWSGCLKCTLD